MKMITALFCMSCALSAGAAVGSPGLNFCNPLPATKKYISTEFHTYPRNVIFQCTYECNLENTIHTVTATSDVTIRNFEEDAYMTACQGVVVKKTKWGFDFDKVESFYAPETKLIELKRWAFENISLNPETNLQERARLSQLKTELAQVSSAYITAGNSGAKYFMETGIALAKITEGLPMDTKKLDDVIARITESNSSSDQVTGLVDSVIKSIASWRIPPAN